jgi:hypothetical protein
MPIPAVVIEWGTRTTFKVAPPGVNALTAPDTSLLMSLSLQIDQIGMRGIAAAPWPKTIVLAFDAPPMVLLTSTLNRTLYARPYPSFERGALRNMQATCGSTGKSMIISGGAETTVASYVLFRRTF